MSCLTEAINSLTMRGGGQSSRAGTAEQQVSWVVVVVVVVVVVKNWKVPVRVPQRYK
jgi:hypothetical protein